MLWISVGWFVLAALAWGGEPYGRLSFLVVKEDNGKPVRNAAVVLHPVNTNGKQGRGGFELKTDSDGKTHFEGVPYGKLRVQVLAPGFPDVRRGLRDGEPRQRNYGQAEASAEAVFDLRRPAREPKKDAPPEKPQ